MINMLPIEERKRLRTAYRFRVAALASFIMAVCALIAVALLAPAYFITDIKRQTVIDRLKSMDTSELDTKVGSLNSIISDINSRLTIFKDPEETIVLSSDALLPVLQYTNDNLFVNSFSAERTPEGAFTISVSGVAKNRTALLSFERALRSVPSFSGVNVPISNFVRGEDILFTIEFMRNEKK
jgi:hypothetical protein